MNRIHVLHIRDSGGIFGGDRAILTLARNLDRNLFDLTLLCMRGPDGRGRELMGLASRLGIRTEGLDVRGRLDFKAMARLRDFVREHGVAIVHTHDFKSDFYGIWATAGLDVRRVATAHGSTRDSWRKRAYLFFDEYLAYRFFDRVIAVSEDLLDGLGPATGRGRLALVPNGLDPDLLGLCAGEDEQDLPVPRGQETRTFAVIGRLYADKGHEVFLRAFALAAPELPEAAGLIAGDGPEREAVLRRIRSSGLEDRVHYCGVRRDMKRLYGTAHCVVIPSYTEGLPYVLLEAMGLGIPVIATSVGDIPKLVRDGVTGWLVEPGDAEAMAGRMKDFVRRPEQARAMAAEAKRLVLMRYPAAGMARSTEGLYLSLARGGACPCGKAHAREVKR
ncbi:MAG TPA: glycosyltransferase [Deltaproteobacteria bacterium]|jgi:glycosyltransferase involved in cell wall biosynthesis|nr:glycosyltransferase [Deltaproteobacteria bacterium]